VNPSLAGNDGVGQDAIVTFDALRRLDPTAEVANAMVAMRADAPAGAAAQLWRATHPGSSEPLPTIAAARPASIVNTDRIRSTPYLLVGVLGGLGVLIIGYVVPTSIRRRRKDWAVLRTMGADRSWITRAALWQGLSIAVLPVAIGVPVGLLAGARLFRLFSDAMGVVDSAAAPFVWSMVVVAVVLALAVLAAAVAIRRPAVRPPSALLRTE
jgi:predicted lysophospholipase L1 biosynthesis ABC-type transport system permease subunit